MGISVMTYFKLLLLGMFAFPAHASINICDENISMGMNKGEVITCDDSRKILFGYDSLEKRASWASYAIDGIRHEDFISNAGRYSDQGAVDKTLVLSREYLDKGYDLAYLVAPYLTGINKNIDNIKSMNNTFPVDPVYWRGKFSDVFWNLNQQEILFAQKKGAYKVITGLHYSESDPVAPSHLYKIYVHPKYSTTLSLLIPINSDVSSDITQYITSIDCIEKTISLDLHLGLEVNIESDIENKKARSLDVWSVMDGDNVEDKLCAI